LRVNYGTAANSYDYLFLPASSSNRLAFQFPELAFPILAKNLGYRLACLFNYLIVGVNEIPIQSPGYLFSHQRFTGA
jgi:hypothetical protein